MSTALRDAIFWIAVASCAVAQLFIIRAVFRTAVRPPASDASRSDVTPGAAAPTPADLRPARLVPMPRRPIEIAWAILPAVLMIAAFVGAWRLMHPDSP